MGEQVARRKRAEREARLARRDRGWKLKLALAVVLIVAVVAGSLALYRSPILTVRRYRLVGAGRLKLERVLALAAPPKDATLIRFPVEDVRRRIAQDPWVAEVTVHRRLPDTIEIVVTERKPVAVVEAGKAAWLVDGRGWVIGPRALEPSAGLVVVRRAERLKPVPGKRLASAEVQNALAVLSGISREMRSQVRYVDAPSVEECGLITHQNVDILMGKAADLGKKDLIARKILAEEKGKVVFIDVRSTERPVSRGISK